MKTTKKGTPKAKISKKNLKNVNGGAAMASASVNPLYTPL